MPPFGIRLHRAALASGAIVLTLSLASGTLALRRAVLPVATTAELCSPEWRKSGPASAGQRAADRVIERQVRRAIRADPSLGQAARLVKVTSRAGVVRLEGRVRTAKERSSIAFKAGQNAWGGHVDNRVTLGDGAEGAA